MESIFRHARRRPYDNATVLNLITRVDAETPGTFGTRHVHLVADLAEHVSRGLKRRRSMKPGRLAGVLHDLARSGHVEQTLVLDTRRLFHFIGYRRRMFAQWPRAKQTHPEKYSRRLWYPNMLRATSSVKWRSCAEIEKRAFGTHRNGGHRIVSKLCRELCDVGMMDEKIGPRRAKFYRRVA